MENEYEYTTIIDGYSIGVDKVGGGTVGKAYAGENWEVTVMNGDVFELDNDILYVGMPKTHAQVAHIALDFAYERIDGGE